MVSVGQLLRAAPYEVPELKLEVITVRGWVTLSKPAHCVERAELRSQVGWGQSGVWVQRLQAAFCVVPKAVSLLWQGHREESRTAHMIILTPSVSAI